MCSLRLSDTLGHILLTVGQKINSNKAQMLTGQFKATEAWCWGVECSYWGRSLAVPLSLLRVHAASVMAHCKTNAEILIKTKKCEMLEKKNMAIKILVQETKYTPSQSLRKRISWPEVGRGGDGGYY